MRKISYFVSPGLLALLLGITGCTEIDPQLPTPTPTPTPTPEPLPGAAQRFESDLPNSATPGGPGGNAVDAGLSAGPTTGSAPPSAPAKDSASNDGGGAAERAIVEADVVQVSGTRLYALSRVAGLTVIDLTDLAQLKVLGRFRELSGTPFEMYLRDGVVLAMYSSWGEYVKTTEGKYQFVQTSKVVALDVADPAAIAKIGSFDIAGEVSDSRIVGDVMYVVGYQNGYCWGCTQNQPLTSVLSLNVKDPRAVSKVDELRFDDAKNNYGWSKRSITVTQKRMYVAGPEYGQNEPQGSTIQVIDIADPAGDLVEGATVAASGQISSRWQMDEHEGVLRVISQIPQWWRGRSDAAPQIQTFKVESSQLVTPLASVDMQIPKNETLRSVRYDGPRAYAITAEQMDPLFTIDLSDPLKPRQVGELEMPGWIYHMEPRGNRVIGLGYDQGNKEGAITVSVFDVTDLAHPTMLDRVNFGGDWAHLPEDQDRIHKAFKVLDERGLVLVPFDGWSSGPRRGSQCYSSYQSGVQLIDLAQDDLTLRGTAPARGQARRAIVQENKLLTVSDEAVDAFDITDRAQPAPLGRLTIARNVSRSLLLKNGSVARINENWYGAQNSTLDLVPLAQVDRPDITTAELNLSQLLAKSDSCWSYTWVQQAFAHENQINLVYQRYEQDESVGQYYKPGYQVTGVLTLDATDPAAPVVLSKHEQRQSSTESSWSPFYSYYSYGYNPAQDNMVRTANAIVTLEQRYSGSSNAYSTRLRIVSLADPKQPSETTLPLEDAASYGGLVVDGNDVLLSHLEKTADNRGRFYLDRVDLTHPAAPKLAAKINIPGTLLHHDRARGRMLTSELKRVDLPNLRYEECYSRFAFADFRSETGGSSPRGTCSGYSQTLHLVRMVEGGAALDGSLPLGEGERITSSSLGDGRVAAVIGYGHSFYGPVYDCFGPCGGGASATARPVEILTLGGFEDGKLESGRLAVGSDLNAWWGYYGTRDLYASGTRALVLTQNDAAVVDLANPTAPVLLRTVQLAGYPQDVHAQSNTVVLALGMNGVQRIDL